jgi:hypothetical protein
VTAIKGGTYATSPTGKEDEARDAHHRTLRATGNVFFASPEDAEKDRPNSDSESGKFKHGFSLSNVCAVTFYPAERLKNGSKSVSVADTCVTITTLNDRKATPQDLLAHTQKTSAQGRRPDKSRALCAK